MAEDWIANIASKAVHHFQSQLDYGVPFVHLRDSKPPYIGYLLIIRPRKQESRVRAQALSGRQEAHLVAIACSSPPEGHVSWTLHLLADKVVELEFAGSISLETVRQILKKTNSSRGRRKSGASPR